MARCHDGWSVPAVFLEWKGPKPDFSPTLRRADLVSVKGFRTKFVVAALERLLLVLGQRSRVLAILLLVDEASEAALLHQLVEGPNRLLDGFIAAPTHDLSS